MFGDDEYYIKILLLLASPVIVCYNANNVYSMLRFYLLYFNVSYLQPDPDSFGEGPLGKNCLYLGHNSAAQNASLRTDQITVLLDARHDCKVLWKISGDDAANALPLQLLWRVQLWRVEAKTTWRGR